MNGSLAQPSVLNSGSGVQRSSNVNIRNAVCWNKYLMLEGGEAKRLSCLFGRCSRCHGWPQDLTTQLIVGKPKELQSLQASECRWNAA